VKYVIFIVLSAAVYLGLHYYVYLPVIHERGSLPIDVFVTFLHEFGHAFAAVITGGKATQLVISPDIPLVAGYACHAGGFQPLVSMGGYVGSALFGAFLLYSAVRENRVSKYGFRILAVLMVGSQLLWFPYGQCGSFYAGARDAAVSVLICGVFAGVFWLISRVPYSVKRYLLTFLGTASLMQIVLDINVGPSSDLQKFDASLSVIGLLVPIFVWKLLWLGIVLFIFFWVVRMAYRQALSGGKT